MKNAMWVTLKNLFRRPTTVEFPEVRRVRAERFRANFALLKDETGDEACIGCLACERICPSGVIHIKTGPKRESPVTGKKRGYADDLTIDTGACLGCELCVQVCPTDALVMLKVPERAAYHREELVLSMAKLYEHGLDAHGWASGSKLMAMQEPPKAPKPARPAPVDAPAPVAAADKPAEPSAGEPAKAVTP
jgi:NADH-quinone oxidoreductase subunit I